MTGIHDWNARGKHQDFYTVVKLLGDGRTPFSNSIFNGNTKTVAEISSGHSWQYRNEKPTNTRNAHIVGSSPSTIDFSKGVTVLNHYQIFKEAYGTSGSANAGLSADGKKEFDIQKALSFSKIKRDIEYAILRRSSPDYVVPSQSDAGLSSSIYHWKSQENTERSTTLDLSMIKAMCRAAFNMGINIDSMIISETLKDELDKVLDGTINTTSNDSSSLSVVSYNKISPFASAPKGIKIYGSTNLSDGAFVLYAKRDIGLIYRRAFDEIPYVTSDDAKLGQVITEATLRVETPYSAMFGEVA